MASKLSSYLVKQDLIPVKKLDRAFKRQVLHGGTLDTTLIEMGLFSELSIIRSIVEVSGIPTIQITDIQVSEIKELVKVFPPKLAKRYSVIPVTKFGDFLGVLVNPEIEKIKLEEMGFMLGITIIPRVVPEIRLWELGKQIYGFELEPRIEKILSKVGPVTSYPGELVQDFNLENYAAEKSPVPESSKDADPEDDLDEDEALVVPEEEHPSSQSMDEIPSLSEETTPIPPEVETPVPPEVETPVPVETETPEPEPAEVPASEPRGEERSTLMMGSDMINNVITQEPVPKEIPSAPQSDESSSLDSEEGSHRDDMDMTPVPSFEYIERDLSSDVLLPTLNGGYDATGEKLPTIEEARREEELSDFEEEVTRPGFEIRGRMKNDTQVKDLVLNSDDDEFSEPDHDNSDTRPVDVTIDPNSEALPPAGAPEDAGFVLPDMTMPMVIPKAMPTGTSDFVSFDGSPITLVNLVSGLIDIDSRDEMLINFLRFGSQFVDFIYLFTVSGDAAQGKFAIFNGQVDQHNVRNYLIALDFPSLLQEAKKSKGFVGEAPTDEGNGFVFDYLSLGRPKNVAVFPVAIGKRVVAILFGATNKEFPPSLFNDMTTAAVTVSKGLLRLIKEKKIARSLDSLKKIQSSKKLKVVKKFKSGSKRAELSGGAVIPTKNVNDAVTVPMSSDSDSESSLETIIALFDRLEHLSHQQDKLDMTAAKELKMHKEQTLEVLAFYFPGMITYKMTDDLRNIPPPSEHGPLLNFVVHWGLPCVPVMMDLLDSENPTVRFYAVYLFSEIRLPEVLYRIGEKLFDSDKLVRNIAGRVLLSYEGHKELVDIISNIRNFLLSEEPFLQKCSVEAIGRLRDKNSIETLVSLFDRGQKELSALASDALTLITLRDFGEKRERWNSWLALNKRRHRILWLIEALRANNRDLRLEAHNELVRLVGSDMGYSPELEGEEMELAIRNWIAWWENKGRHIFPG